MAGDDHNENLAGSNISLQPQPELEDSNNIDQIEVGKQFPDSRSCRATLRAIAVARNFELKILKSDKGRFTVKCANEECNWRVYASKLPNSPTFAIKTMNDKHTCDGITRLDHQQASAEWAANALQETLRKNPNTKPKEISEEIFKVHEIVLPYHQARRAKECVMETLGKKFEENYRLLPEYCYMIKRINPGNIVSVYRNPEGGSFQKLFVSFQASIFGFSTCCRPVLVLDRVPIKSKYSSTLLFATSFDGDGNVFPLAFSIVDEEKAENWTWFISELGNLLEANYKEKTPRLTILSDGQKGIVDGLEKHFETAFHGLGMGYLMKSFKTELNDSRLVQLFWEAANSLTVVEFEKNISRIKKISKDAADRIKNTQPRLWASAYIEGTGFGQLTVNMAESIPNWVREITPLPILDMIEFIHAQLMGLFDERRKTCTQWGKNTLVPSAEKHLSETIELGNSYEIRKAGENTYKVIVSRDNEGNYYEMVDIHTRKCTCRGWQVHSLPCSHTVAALRHREETPYLFAESYFTVAYYQKTYSAEIHAVPDRAHWKEMLEGFEDAALDRVIINPPKSVQPERRARKWVVRPVENGREKRAVNCSRCNKTGHYRQTCDDPV